MHHQMTDHMRQCVEACLKCYAACIECAHHCTGMGGEQASAGHLGALADCAKLCETSANFMLRESPQHGDICGACADACERCAESCEKLGGDDEMMKRCAEACRRCAESCRQMGQMA